MTFRRLNLCFISAFAVVLACRCTASPFLLGTPAGRRTVEMGSLPNGAAAALFTFEVEGPSFGIYARSVPAGLLTIELGFVETDATGPNQRAFAVAANGVPLDANLDVWKEAGGANRPWVLKSSYDHAGGMLTLLFSGLKGDAILSFARAIDAGGNVVAFGTAENWTKPERLRAADARSRPFRPVKAGEVKFFNVDHSPMGAWSTFVYGMAGSGGIQVANLTDLHGNLMPEFGIVVLTRSDAGCRIMPFADPVSVIGCPARPIREAEVTRRLGPATDFWSIGSGVSWRHYSPMWHMASFAAASPAERRRFALPATWMDWELDNRRGKSRLQVVFSLQQPAARSPEGWGGYEGYVIGGNSAIAIRRGEAELLDEGEVKREYGVGRASSAFRMTVAPGESRQFRFVIAHFIPGAPSALSGGFLALMHAVLFRGLADVIATADHLHPDAVRRSAAVDALLRQSGLGQERQELAADAVHSYLYNTVLWEDRTTHRPVFGVEEGECRFINTLDLTVDNLFYELSMHPWTVRNELDTFLDHYSFVDQLVRPDDLGRKFPGGLGFYHDMGTGLHFANPRNGQAYSALMTQEELQNWLCCAGIYWHATGDRAWLVRHASAFRRGFESMLRRDDVDPARRDGVTTYLSYMPGRRRKGEITTYDAMDRSLQQPTDSLYITVKSFGTYLVLAQVFQALNDGDAAEAARAAADRTSASLIRHWNPVTRTFPATFDGATHSMIIPAIEGLVYPFAMGRGDLVSPTGPYAELISDLKAHLESVLVPGVCLDAKTGAWVLSSTSTTTWESKVYLNQFIAERILGVRDNRTGGPVDEAQLGYEVLGAPAVAWTCQFTNRDHLAFGCRHYPRGVTSALWWLYSP